jgi:hypothetical protein
MSPIILDSATVWWSRPSVSTFADRSHFEVKSVVDMQQTCIRACNSFNMQGTTFQGHVSAAGFQGHVPAAGLGSRNRHCNPPLSRARSIKFRRSSLNEESGEELLCCPWKDRRTSSRRSVSPFPGRRAETFVGPDDKSGNRPTYACLRARSIRPMVAKTGYFCEQTRKEVLFCFVASKTEVREQEPVLWRWDHNSVDPSSTPLVTCRTQEVQYQPQATKTIKTLRPLHLPGCTILPFRNTRPVARVHP